MDLEIILKFLLSVFLGIILLLSKRIKCSTDNFVSTIILGIASVMSAVFIKSSGIILKSNPLNSYISFLVFFGIIIAIFVILSIKEKNGPSFPIEALILILTSFIIGFDFYILAFTTILITIISSVSITYLVKKTKSSSLSVYIISIEENASTVVDIKKILIDLGIKFKNIKLAKSKNGYVIELFINTSKNKNREFIERSMQLKGVVEITSETF